MTRVARLDLSRSNDLEAVRYWNRRCTNGTFGPKVVRNQTSFFLSVDSVDAMNHVNLSVIVSTGALPWTDCYCSMWS
jgi:hypothetical protein